MVLGVEMRYRDSGHVSRHRWTGQKCVSTGNKLTHHGRTQSMGDNAAVSCLRKMKINVLMQS